MPLGGFTVKLARSGHKFDVPEDDTILEVLKAAGLEVPSSCEQGVCGTCETTVLEGIPDHQDLLMSADEHAENRTMMICCSGALSDILVLDL
jgi:ferredoxin